MRAAALAGQSWGPDRPPGSRGGSSPDGLSAQAPSRRTPLSPAARPEPISEPRPEDAGLALQRLIYESGPLGGKLVLGGAAIAVASIVLPWLQVSRLFPSGSTPALDAHGDYFAGGLAQFGLAGNLANSGYLVLAAAVAGWLAWILLTKGGRTRDLRLLLGCLGVAAGAVILVVMIAVMLVVTAMPDRYVWRGTTATAGPGLGVLVAIAGGAAIIGGALISMVAKPEPEGAASPRLIYESGPLGGKLVLGGAAIAVASVVLPWLQVSRVFPSGSTPALDAHGDYFAGGLAQFGLAGNLANSGYLVLAAAVAGWLAWILLTKGGRTRDLRLLLGCLGVAAGAVILVVMIAVMLVVTAMPDRYVWRGTTATAGPGLGVLVAIAGGAAIIGGALISMVAKPEPEGAERELYTP